MNSELILCKGIKMDKEYENVLSYSESDIVTLCRNNAIYTGTEYKVIGVRQNVVNISATYAECIYANYLAFKNPNFGNKWFFAWVTDVKLLNPSTTQISFKIDVWSTWYSSFVVGKAFIEREHVADDTVGKHTIPEGLETGSYVIKNEVDATDLQDVCPVVCATVDPVGNNSYATYCGNRYEALGYYIFKGALMSVYNGGDQADAIKAYIEAIPNDDAIVSIFMAPKKLVGWTTTGTWTVFSGGLGYAYRDAMDVFNYTTQGGQIGTYYDRPITFTDLSTTRPTSIGSYTPKNNKLFVWPYSYINLTNNNGGNAMYRYEDFSSNTPTFEIDGIISPSCSIRAIPKNYKGLTSAYNDGLQGAKYPICSWQNDIYTNWLTQQAVNIGIDTVKNVGSIIAGASFGSAGTATSGLMGIASTLGSIYQHSLIPPQAEGNINGGDIGASKNKITFTIQNIQIREEMAKVIDQFFSRYGYKVDEVKTPNLNSRTKFNFIKVGGMDELISGDIPAVDLEEINRIFRKGVTIFHNYEDFGNYTITNSIVTQ